MIKLTSEERDVLANYISNNINKTYITLKYQLYLQEMCENTLKIRQLREEIKFLDRLLIKINSEIGT